MSQYKPRTLSVPNQRLPNMSEIAQQIIASSSGALITSIFMTPLDVVKIRLQAQTKGFVRGECFMYCNGLMDHLCTCLNGDAKFTAAEPVWRKPAVQLTGTLDALIKIPRTEGIASLWSGLPPTLVMAIPNTVIYFTVYDQLKSYFKFDSKSGSLLIPTICGSLARGVSVTVITPLELIRTKMQSEKLTYREINSAIRTSLQQGGILSLWRGWSPMIWRDVPFSGLYFTGYESLKKYRLQITEKDRLSVVESFTFGAISGSIAGIITLPLDVVKTHRQVELGSSPVNPTRGRTTLILKQLYRSKGITSWFTGLGPRILKVSPACAIMISSYEWCKYRFSKNKKDSTST